MRQTDSDEFMNRPIDPETARELIASLTPREREVLALVEAGHTYRKIADELVISKRTVEGHVSRIREKFWVGNRSRASYIARVAGFEYLEMTKDR